MRIDVLTLFPEMFGPVIGGSILGRAAEKGIIDVRLTDIRDSAMINTIKQMIILSEAEAEWS